jgi:hypothetical protein
MKTITRTKVYLPMAALMLTVAIAIPAAAQQQVPFKGTFQGKDCVPAQNTGCSAMNPPLLETSGSGIGTHMGEFSLTQQTNLATFNGSAHWVVANGDSIDSTFIASPDFTTQSLGYITVTETHTIVRGTGRFAGAQGSFILERTHLIALSADGTHVTFGSIRNGSITSPGAAH